MQTIISETLFFEFSPKYTGCNLQITPRKMGFSNSLAPTTKSPNKRHSRRAGQITAVIILSPENVRLFRENSLCLLHSNEYITRPTLYACSDYVNPSLLREKIRGMQIIQKESFFSHSVRETCRGFCVVNKSQDTLVTLPHVFFSLTLSDHTACNVLESYSSTHQSGVTSQETDTSSCPCPWGWLCPNQHHVQMYGILP